MNYLIVGGSGEAGQASLEAIAALKTKGQTVGQVWATTSKETGPEEWTQNGITAITSIDLTANGYIDKIKGQVAGPLLLFLLRLGALSATLWLVRLKQISKKPASLVGIRL